MFFLALHSTRGKGYSYKGDVTVDARLVGHSVRVDHEGTLIRQDIAVCVHTCMLGNVPLRKINVSDCYIKP